MPEDRDHGEVIPDVPWIPNEASMLIDYRNGKGIPLMLYQWRDSDDEEVKMMGCL
jgi:hypothetical protein